MKKTNNQNKVKKECPLCQISEQTLEQLKKENHSMKTNHQPKPRLSQSGLKSALLIVLVLAAGFLLFKFFPVIPAQPEEPAEKSQSSQPAQKEETNLFSALSKEVVGLNKPAPNFAAKDVQGNEVSLSSFQGNQAVLLVFWATWCRYCAKELPDLKEFTQAHQNEIKVIAVTAESQKTIENYLEKEEINFLVLLDEKREIWNQYAVRGTPSHFLIDQGGKIRLIWPGLASADDLEAMAEKIKGE